MKHPLEEQLTLLILCFNPQFFPEYLNLAEDGGEHQVEVVSTVPIPCRETSDRCGLALVLSVHDPGRSKSP